jgi:predicted Fe-Mo cluster-binding NifX family protein
LDISVSGTDRDECRTTELIQPDLSQEPTMKIAIVTDDERTISQHFGRAPYYLVVTIEDGQIVQRELREKLGHAQFASEPHGHDHESHSRDRGHGFGLASQSRHARMAEVISDCLAVLCGGMGAGAYENMRTRGIQPVVTGIAEIDEAVMAYVEGRIVDRTDWLH